MAEKTERYESPIDEAVKRLRRIETRQMRMAQEQGLDPVKGRDRVSMLDPDIPVLDVSGLDVSLGDLIDFCRKSGINQTVSLEYRDRVLGSFRLGEHDGQTKIEA